MFRVQVYIRNGWSNKVIDPDGKEQEENSTKSDSVCLQLPGIPTGVWQPMKDAFVGEAAHENVLIHQCSDHQLFCSENSR